MLAALGLLAACGGSSPAPARPVIPVAFYGDSLLHESRAPLRAALGPSGGRAPVRSVPGAAVCNLLPRLRADLTRVRPRLVVLETVGNDLTACIRERGGPTSAAHRRATVADVDAFVRTARDAGARVLVVDPPPFGAQSAATAPAVEVLVRDLHRRFAHTPGVGFTGAPSEAVAPGRVFTVTLPCLPSEQGRADCRGGRIVVRDPYFGVHLCPSTYADDRAVRRGCPVYSSGAVRFGSAVAGVAAGR